MGILFDPRKLYPIDDEVEHYTLEDFHQIIATDDLTEDDGAAYYATAEGYIMESPYWNLAKAPDWATHVVFIAK